MFVNAGRALDREAGLHKGLWAEPHSGFHWKFAIRTIRASVPSRENALVTAPRSPGGSHVSGVKPN